MFRCEAGHELDDGDSEGAVVCDVTQNRDESVSIRIASTQPDPT
jgi:hypothetical protein